MDTRLPYITERLINLSGVLPELQRERDLWRSIDDWTSKQESCAGERVDNLGQNSPNH